MDAAVSGKHARNSSTTSGAPVANNGAAGKADFQYKVHEKFVHPLITVQMQRYGSLIKIKPQQLEEYKKLHAAVWPGVLDMIHQCHIRNYSIYHKDGLLFSYFEYTGSDFDADMDKMAADPLTQQWWDVCKPCQEPWPTRKKGEWWATMDEIFHFT